MERWRRRKSISYIYSFPLPVGRDFLELKPFEDGFHCKMGKKWTFPQIIMLISEVWFMNYRDRLDIIADVLNVARQNPRKTQIMYGANLSYKVLQKYLGEVISASLVAFDNVRQHYMLTDKGEEFLQLYKEYSKVNKIFERHLILVQAKRSELEDLCADTCP